MNRIDYKHDIVGYENFLPEEECKKIIDYWNYRIEKGNLQWNAISFYESYAFGFEDEDEDLLLFNLPKDYFMTLKEKIKKATEESMGRSLKEVSYHAQRWIAGGFGNMHSDNSTNGEYNSFERSKYATFLYLNDDFEGGALNFRDHPIKIKPKIGMLVSFDGGAENEHEVQVIESGERYTIGSFWDYLESNYDDEKKAKWEEDLRIIREQQAIEQKEWADLREKGERMPPPPKRD